MYKNNTSDEALAKIALAFYQPDKIASTLKTSWLKLDGIVFREN